MGDIGNFIVALIIVGAVLFLIDRVAFLDDTIKLIIKVLVVVFILIWAIRLLLPMAGLG